MKVYHQNNNNKWTGWQLTLPGFHATLWGGGRGREVSVHPGRGDYGDPAVAAQVNRDRRYQSRVAIHLQEAQEARDKVHKARTRAFWAKKHKARKE